MKIAIISGDPVYARMLFLSLTEKNAVCVCLAPGEAAEGSFDFILLDAAGYEAARAGLPGGVSVILFGTREQINAIPEAEVRSFFLLIRPFYMENLYSVLFAGRYENEKSDPHKDEPLGIVLDSVRRLCYMRGEQVSLSRREYDLFSLLMENRGTVVTREMAGALFLGDETEQKSNVVDVYIKYLREKLDEHFGIKLIRTVRGKGYCIE